MYLAQNQQHLRESLLLNISRCVVRIVVHIGSYQVSITSTILSVAFTRSDPESAKKDSSVVSLFVLSGSASSKAARGTLMKLTPGFSTSKNTF